MATMAAECSSALTGLGPSIARDSQNENGSWAALPSAATSTPAATTCRHPALLAGQVGQRQPGSAGQRGTRRRRTARGPPCAWSRTRSGPRRPGASSRHQNPISAYDVAPITSHASSSAGSVAAVDGEQGGGRRTAASARGTAPGTPGSSPAAKTSTSSVTAATVGATSAASASTPSARSLPAMNGTDTAAASRATTTASAAVTRRGGQRRRPRRARSQAARGPARHPTTAGSSTSSHSAVWLGHRPLTPTGPWPCRSCRPAAPGAAASPPRSPSPSRRSSRR